MTKFTGDECALCGQLLVEWTGYGFRPDYKNCAKGTKTHLDHNGSTLDLEIVPVCRCTAEDSAKRRAR